MKSNVCKLTGILMRKERFSRSVAMRTAWQIVRFAESYIADGAARETAYEAAHKGCVAQARREEIRKSCKLAA